MLSFNSEKVHSALSAVRSTADSIQGGANVVSSFHESQGRLFAHPQRSALSAAAFGGRPRLLLMRSRIELACRSATGLPLGTPVVLSRLGLVIVTQDWSIGLKPEFRLLLS